METIVFLFNLLITILDLVKNVRWCQVVCHDNETDSIRPLCRHLHFSTILVKEFLEPRQADEEAKSIEDTKAPVVEEEKSQQESEPETKGRKKIILITLCQRIVWALGSG